MKITYPPVILLCGLIAQVILYFTFPVLVNLSILFGILILIIGISLVYISLRKLSKMKTTFIPDGKPEKLVMDGPFRFSRNPIYLGMLLILVGVSISLQSFSSLMISIVFGLIINFTWIKHEEKKLEDIFDSEWEEYSKRTRRWL